MASSSAPPPSSAAEEGAQTFPYSNLGNQAGPNPGPIAPYQPQINPGPPFAQNYGQPGYYPAGYIAGPINGMNYQNQRRGRFSGSSTENIIWIIVSCIGVFVILGFAIYFNLGRGSYKKCIRCRYDEPYCYRPYGHCTCRHCREYRY